MGEVSARLSSLGIELPPPPAPVAAYVPWTAADGLIFVSGQVSTGPDGDVTGTLGVDAGIDDGVAAARLCGLNLLSQLQSALDGNLDRVEQVMKITGYAKAAPGFTDIPQVVDGCSKLLTDVLGERGRHARAAVGCPELPRGCLVEVEAVVRVSR